MARSPPVIINSVDLKRMIGWMNAGELDKVTDYLAEEFEKLQKAGVDFAALTANTPHIVFDELQQRTTLPLISIVEATCERAQSLGFKSVGLFGTRYTMQAPFYPKVFCAHRHQAGHTKRKKNRTTFTRNISANC